MLPTITTIFAVLYAFGLWYWLKRINKTASIKLTRNLLWTHAVLLILFFISIYLSAQYNLSFRGMWTFRIIAWLFLLTGVFIYPLGHKSQFNKGTRLYFFIFSTLPTLVGLFVLVPFLGVVLILSLYGRLSGAGDTLLYSDKNIRVQTTFTGVLGPSYLDMYKKEGILERRIYRSNTGWFSRVDSVKSKIQNHQLQVALYHDQSEGTRSPLVVTAPQ